MTLYLTESEVNEVLTMELALESVEEAFRLMSEGGATNPPRSRIRLPAGGLFNFMCAAAPGAGVMGLKAYGVTRGNPVKFYVQLFSTETGELLALLEAGDLGQVRTGAASGVATKYMAREDAETVGVIGSGYQARTQLEAVCNVRPIKRARVFSRNAERQREIRDQDGRAAGHRHIPGGERRRVRCGRRCRHRDDERESSGPQRRMAERRNAHQRRRAPITGCAASWTATPCAALTS